MKKKLLEKLEVVQWISPDVKQEAIDKINRLDGKFLGSDIFFNYTLLQQRYRGVWKLNLSKQKYSFNATFHHFSEDEGFQDY